MKKIFMLLMLFISFTYSAIDEYKTDVYFGNGILTKEKDAKFNAEIVLKPAIIDKLGLDYYNKHIGKVSYAYNRTIGDKGDLWESFYQIIGLQESVDWWSNIALWFVDKTTIHSIDIEAQVDKYEASIKNGHKVLVVAHSQGNLFAHEAYVKLGERSKNKWYQQYWEAVSIASPDPYSDIKPDMLPRIGWNNDLVARMGYGGHKIGIACDVVHVTWEGKPYLLGDPVPPKPTSPYVNRNQTGEEHMNWWKATNGWLDNLDSNVHAFTFYMGLKLKEGNEKSPLYATYKNGYTNILSDSALLTDGTAKIIILKQIKKQIEKLETLSSQWKPKNLGCSCKTKYAKMTHVYDAENMDQYLENVKVKNFTKDGAGKIYQVDGHYVRAPRGGTNIVENNESEICYILADDESIEIGSIKGPSEIAEAAPGAVTVALDWENSDADLDLEVKWDAGEYDIKDIECPKEHWLIQNKNSVTEGRYAIWANLKSLKTGDTNVTDTVVVDINVLGKTMPLVATIENESDYNIGHVADIIIEYVNGKYEPKIEFVPHKKVYGGTGGGEFLSQRKEPTCEETYDKYNCQCMPCSAKIIPYLEQALAGPLSGAEFKLYEASDYVNGLPLYAGETSAGESILTAGIIKVDKNFTDTLDDNKLYLIEARGGIDVDSNDDYISDGTDVNNQGSLRAVVLGKDLKTNGYKINLLTEISYQVIKDRIGKIDDTLLRTELDDISQYLLRGSIYGGEITYTDIINWMPTLDKERLFYDYDKRFDPVVQKIYADQDIYDDAIALVYGLMESPRLKGLYLEVPEDVQNNAYIGSVEIVSEGNSSIQTFTLSGEGSENFRIDLQGNIYVSEIASIDFESCQTYDLEATAANADGNTTVGVTIDVMDIYDAPFAKEYRGGILFGNTPSGTPVSKIIFDPGKSKIDKMELIGDEVRYFDINTSGDITVSELGLPVIKQDTKFHFDVIVYNKYGASRPVGITLWVKPVKDTPSLYGFTAHVDEHAPADTLIHTVSFVSGSAPVDAFVLSGEGSENFIINMRGEVRVSEKVDLDYEKRKSYSLSLGARNQFGLSENVNVNILLNDVVDTPVLKENQQFSVDENITSAWLIGNILKEKGLSDVNSMNVSDSLFTVDMEGNIRVTEGRSLDYETKQTYDVTVTASNRYGESLPVVFTVNVNDVTDVATLSPFQAKITENTTVTEALGQIEYIKGTSEVESFQILGQGSEKFEVDSQGVVRVAPNVVFDYEERSIYDLKIWALNASGYSKPVDFNVTVENVLDAPELQSKTWRIDENSKDIMLNGTILLNEGLSPVKQMVIRDRKGNISTDLEVGLDGSVHVLPDADLDYEKGSMRQYNVVAYNDQGFSKSVTLTINLKNVLDAPELKTFTGSIDENASFGTVIGSVEYNPGLSDITDIWLEVPLGATYDNPFVIDNAGKISLAGKIDYETRSNYMLFAFARNKQGRSSPASVAITIFDSEDSPVLNSFKGAISEGAYPGDPVGKITYKEGLDTIVSMALSGTGSENFKVDAQGNITLAADAKLDFESQGKYTLWAQAFSQGDNSNIVDVNITVTDVNENARAGSGLWANANVNIYRMEEDGNRTLLFSELTSDMTGDYNRTGLFDSHRLELEQDTFYMYEVYGGEERDADHNGVLDANSTVNLGALHAVTKGEWVRKMQKPLSINLMTDLFCQWLKDDIDSGNYAAMEEKLQDPYNPVVYRDIDGVYHNISWDRGDGRDALVYDPVKNSDVWQYGFGLSERSFMQTLLYSGEMDGYETYVQNTLKNGSYWARPNSSAMLKGSPHLYTVINVNGQRGIYRKNLENNVSMLQETDRTEQIVADRTNDLLYSVANEGEGSYLLTTWDIPDQSSLLKLSDTLIWSSNYLLLSSDSEQLFDLSKREVEKYTVTDPANPIRDALNVQIPGEINHALFSEDDRWLYVANRNIGLQIYGVETMKLNAYMILSGITEKIRRLQDAERLGIVWHNEAGSTWGIVDIGDKSHPELKFSMDLNMSKAYTFTLNEDESLLFVGGYQNGAMVKIYQDNMGNLDFREIVAIPIENNLGDIVEIYLYEPAHRLIVVAEYFMYIYDIGDLENVELIETTQLGNIPG